MLADLAGSVQDLLDEGRERGLYTAAAAGISTPGRGRIVRFAGSLSDTDAAPVTESTLFDLASLSKTVVAAVAVRLADEGRIDLAEPIGSVLDLPERSRLVDASAHHLLTHTSGLPMESFIWRNPEIPVGDRLDRLLATPLESPPGEVFRYSCLGYVALGATLEAVTGRSLPELVHDLIARHLELSSLRYGPVDPRNTAATEDEEYLGRGVVRGQVHDELNWYLGGRAGNSGLFSNASDLLTFAESHLTGVLASGPASRGLTRDMLTNAQRRGFGQGYGPRIDDPEFLGPTPGIGHTGFTGTMWIARPTTGIAGVLLTNRVHPHRGRADLHDLRRAFSALTVGHVD